MKTMNLFAKVKIATLMLLICVSCDFEVAKEPCSTELFVEVRKWDTSCGTREGDIIVQVSGGDQPYTYSWSHDSSINGRQVSDLGQGVYTVIITDQSGRQSVSQIIIN